MGTFHRTLFTIFTWLSILISFLTVQRGAGAAPTNGAHTSTSRGNSGIFARPGHRSQRRILLPATAPMNHLSSCSEGTKATCRRNCIYIHVYVWIINGVGCETFDDIYLYICGSTYEKIYLYICITCTICSIVKYQQTKKIEWKINQKPPQIFSTGWCYQPVLMPYTHPGLARATWWHFSAGSWRTGTKGGAFSPHSLVSVGKPALKAVTNRHWSPVLY